MIPVSTFLLVAALEAGASAFRPYTYMAQGPERTRIPVDGESLVLQVPGRHGAAGGTIDLFLMRLKATTPKPGAPILYLHGGPGGAALEHLDQADFRALFSELRAEADVILLDQRGCGASKPSLVPERQDRLREASLESRASFLEYLLGAASRVRGRLEKEGHDPRNFDIAQSAEDIESVRLALGASKLTLLAHSYGTQLAQEFARRHPDSVSRLVLISSRGMDTSMKLPGQSETFLTHIAERARTDATVGAQFPDLLATLDRVLKKADASPIEVPVDDNATKTVSTYRVGGFALRFIIAKFYLHDPDSTRYLPKMLDEIDKGRRPWSLTFNLLQMMHAPVSLAWFTTDAASGVSAARGEAIAREAVAARLGNAMNFPFPEINRAFGMKDLGDALRKEVVTTLPALFVVGTEDGITPVAQTEAIRQGFSRSLLLRVENAGHNSVIRPTEVARAIRAFLSDQPVPATARLEPIGFAPLITLAAR